jgi:hypothetical protein
MRRPLFPRESSRAGLDDVARRKILPCRESNPGRSAPSLHWPSHPRSYNLLNVDYTDQKRGFLYWVQEVTTTNVPNFRDASFQNITETENKLVRSIRPGIVVGQKHARGAHVTLLRCSSRNSVTPPWRAGTSRVWSSEVGSSRGTQRFSRLRRTGLTNRFRNSTRMASSV